MVTMLADTVMTHSTPPWQDPLQYVFTAAACDEVPNHLTAAVNQNVFRRLLHGYLHADGLGYWYRHAADVGGATYAYHELLPVLLRRLHGVTIEEVSAAAQPQQSQSLSGWISNLYKLYTRVLPCGVGDPRTVPPAQGHLACALPQVVRRLASELRAPDGLQLYLHGSLVTCDATPYSDVDMLLVVGQEWFESAASVSMLQRIVRSAERWLYRYDPIQHHGLMLVTALDLERYASHYFPLELLRFGYRLAGGGNLHYRLRPSAFENYSFLHGVWQRLIRLENGVEPPPTSQFALKAMLSEMMLLPTYYLQICGQVLYKRDSFVAVRPLLSARALDAMDALSEWRRDWRRSYWESAYRYLAGAPTPIASRILARARAFRMSKSDMQRWRSVLPGARLMAQELIEQAPCPV